MCANRVRIETLKTLEPVASLPEARLHELVDLCHVETARKNSNPFLVRGIVGQAVYLLRGELVLTYPDGSSKVLVAGSERSRYPLGRRGEVFTSVKAITDVELMRIDDDLLDVMATWDEAVSADRSEKQKKAGDEGSLPASWTLMSGMFSVSSLKYGEFSRLPPAHINELLRRFERIDVKKGDAVIREGAEGDFYFVIETGRCKVERTVGGVSMLLADLKSGDAFGEEALVSEARRNATVTMKTDGALLRLSRKDFAELLREPLLHRLSAEEARDKIARGAQWVDVRYPSEYQYDKLAGAINIPLSEIRNAFGVLDKGKEYVLYCQSGRRSAAAAFLLAQRGYRAFVLAGGLWGETKGGA
ncbi:MAG: cyclic nucleotide-binding domain-containing protein [Betaproteobacteria bacterium]|nr:MAG: cyclic nucleotide-binding domain-containing protein [Betaproteobacteria bacterium]